MPDLCVPEQENSGGAVLQPWLIPAGAELEVEDLADVPPTRELLCQILQALALLICHLAGCGVGASPGQH